MTIRPIALLLAATNGDITGAAERLTLAVEKGGFDFDGGRLKRCAKAR